MANEETTSRKYRIVIHNLDADNENVREVVESELGNVEILDWQIEREIYYTEKMNPLTIGTLQRESIVKLNYLEKQVKGGKE